MLAAHCYSRHSVVAEDAEAIPVSQIIVALTTDQLSSGLARLGPELCLVLFDPAELAGYR
jgi:hypothetical protein